MDRLPLHPYDFFGYLGSGLLVVVGMQFVLGFPDVLGYDFHVVDGAILFLGVYVAGQMMATPAKALLEDIVIGRKKVTVPFSVQVHDPDSTAPAEEDLGLRNRLRRNRFRVSVQFKPSSGRSSI